MILVAAFLLLAALGMLAAGLAQGSAALQWGSFAASALAAIVLAVGELRRRRQTSQDDDEPAAVPAEVGARAGAGPAPRTVATGGGSPAMTAPAPDRPDQLPPPAEEAPQEPAPAEFAPIRAVAAPPVSAHAAPEEPPATGAHSAAPVLDGDGEPPVEEVEVTDLLLVLDLTDEVLVVDEHPRYHLAGCPLLAGVATIPVPMDEARSDGFTPCGACAPDRNLAGRERARRSA